MSMNRVELIGRLGRDPETRTLPGGGEVTTFSLATDERWTDKSSGERKSRTTWFQICCFNEQLGKVAQQWLHKGDQIYISGAMQSREYTKDGVTKTVWEVVLQRFRGELVLLGGKSGERPVQSTLDETLDDEIPF